MGDISAEPSMEEILSSIKRIIAEEGDVAQSRPRRPQRPAAAPPVATSPTPEAQPQFQSEPVEEVLELSDPIQPPAPTPPQIEPPARRVAEFPPPPPAAIEPEPASIVSRETAAASRGSLDALTKMRVKPEAGDMTLEALVRELLRPMLSEWLDANLPTLVETMVSREIERITNQQP